MSHKSITSEQLDLLLGGIESKLPEDLLPVWNQVKIQPEKWSESSRGKALGGFWVVAVLGDEVIWYNDYEEGFELSGFKSYGEIGEYWDDGCELEHLLWQVLQ